MSDDFLKELWTFLTLTTMTGGLLAWAIVGYHAVVAKIKGRHTPSFRLSEMETDDGPLYIASHSRYGAIGTGLTKGEALGRAFDAAERLQREDALLAVEGDG